jgi:hypothetical protein
MVNANDATLVEPVDGGAAQFTAIAGQPVEAAYRDDKVASFCLWVFLWLWDLRWVFRALGGTSIIIPRASTQIRACMVSDLRLSLVA